MRIESVPDDDEHVSDELPDELDAANFVGPYIDTPLTRYFQLPLVPTALGFDPRMQFVHESDAIEALRLASTSDRPGTFNVAGDGLL